MSGHNFQGTQYFGQIFISYPTITSQKACSNFLQSSTVINLFKHLQQLAQNCNMAQLFGM
jgi:hypothetical protein